MSMQTEGDNYLTSGIFEVMDSFSSDLATSFGNGTSGFTHQTDNFCKLNQIRKYYTDVTFKLLYIHETPRDLSHVIKVIWWPFLSTYSALISLHLTDMELTSSLVDQSQLGGAVSFHNLSEEIDVTLNSSMLRGKEGKYRLFLSHSSPGNDISSSTYPKVWYTEQSFAHFIPKFLNCFH